MKLVVIEGPGKKDTIKKYLGTGYEVMATKGHIRDLPAKSFGVNLNTFEPEYDVMPDKKDVVKELVSKAKKAEQVLLATDPDREGEAISWHIAHELGLKEEDKCRVVFNEISKNAVQNALANPRKLDKNLIDAQQARRVLDRIVGYKLSPIICKKIQPKLSAGRVQSVALQLVVEREKQILDFVSEEYWTVTAHLKKESEATVFKASLIEVDGKKEKPKNKQRVDEILGYLENNSYVVKNIKKSKSKSHAPAPFITSTMQQDAQSKLGMSLKKISACAQQLYEGVELGSEGKTALITYIRSDSTRVSQEAQQSAREFAKNKYGQDYIPEKPNIYGKKENSQDAHEAIRPIDINKTPEYVKEFLSADNYKLYKLIYERFLASQMSDAIYNSVVVEIQCNNCLFKATGKTLEFAGYTAVYKGIEEAKENEDNKKIPKLNENDSLVLTKLEPEQKFTKPPTRFTEGTLVEAMEKKGIGRPATYAQTITLLATRGYTDKEGKYLFPTKLGFSVTEYLEKFFKSVINVKFTAYMEGRLDDIAEKGENWQEVVSKFWEGFKGLLQRAGASTVTYKEQPVESDEVCEKCGAKMLIREGRFGKFLGCSNFPKCRNIKSLQQPQEKGICPICKKPTTLRKSKKGKEYYACSGYPDCNFMSWDEPTGEKCPNCQDGYLVLKKGETKCNACEFKK